MSPEEIGYKDTLREKSRKNLSKKSDSLEVHKLANELDNLLKTNSSGLMPDQSDRIVLHLLKDLLSSGQLVISEAFSELLLLGQVTSLEELSQMHKVVFNLSDASASHANSSNSGE